MNVTVLGAGMVGSAIARDLAADKRLRVTSIDRDEAALQRLAARAPVTTVAADLADPAVVLASVCGAEVVVCAVPGFMGFRTLETVIRAGRNVVDISFFPEEALLLDSLAREMAVTAVVDCGVAPGLCNIMAGRAVSRMDQGESYACYVGGLPTVRLWPYEYRAVFSPADVIEEYTRPARLVENGREVVRPALSETELMDFTGIGTLEAFNTDGLRTLRHTLALPDMKEKTLRYPGHASLMRILRESGFFGTEPLAVNGQQVRPLDVTSRLLFDQWRLREGEEDLTIMRVEVTGRRGGRRVRHTFDLLDRFDRATGTTAMARTTGYTAALVARQLLAGAVAAQGIVPPENLGREPALWDALMTGYAARGIRIVETEETDPPMGAD